MKRGLVVTVVAVVLLEEALPSPSRGVAGPRVRSNSGSNSGSGSGPGSGPGDDGRGYPHVARDAYLYADAMLVAKELP